MASTAIKRTVVQMAYEECSLAGYEFDVTPEEEFSGLRRLDALMAEWEPTLPLGYNFPGTFGQGNLNDPIGIPDYALDIAAKYLALRIAPMMAKSIDGPARYALAAGMVNLRTQASFIPNAVLPNDTVRGAGNRFWSTYSPFFQGQDAYATPTLGTLSLASTAAVAATVFTTTVSGATDGSTLTLADSVGGFYTLAGTAGPTNSRGIATTIWTLTRVAPSFLGGTEHPVITETLAGAYGSPNANRLTVAVSVSPNLRSLKFNSAPNSGYVAALAA